MAILVIRSHNVPSFNVSITLNFSIILNLIKHNNLVSNYLTDISTAFHINYISIQMNRHQRKHLVNHHLAVQTLYVAQSVIRPVVHVCQDILALHLTVDRSVSLTANAALTKRVLTINVPTLAWGHVDWMQTVELSATHLNVFAEVDTKVIRLTNASQSKVSKTKTIYKHVQNKPI